MSNTLITGLAVAGVIAAGGAAAAVNTTIFADGDESSESAAAAIIAPAADTAPVRAAPTAPDAVAPGQSAPGVATPTTPSIVSVVASTPTEFRVGEAGTVTLSSTGESLTLADATPHAGWTIGETEEEGDELEVTFRSADMTVEFEAELVDGEIVASIDAWPHGSADTIGGNGEAYEHRHDDHDDDDDDDEEEVRDDD